MLSESSNMITSENVMSKEEQLRKYFNERASYGSNTTEKGFEDSKRRVPSCPDPLHN